MQGKDNTKSTLYQLFGQLSDKKIFCLLHKQLGIDRYVKKLTTEKLLFLIVLAQLKQHKGLREISTSIGDDAVSRAIGLESISFSQISRRLASLPTEAFEVLFKHVVSKSIAKMGLQAVERNLNRLNLIDSSTISLSLTRYPWAVFRKTKSGIKLHLRVRVLEEGVLPDEIVITPAKPADRTQMDALVAEDPNAINVFDRGYMDYSKFDIYCEKGIRFVTRLKENAVIKVVSERDVGNESTIKHDSIVILGRGTKCMQHKLRLIETEDTEGNIINILTNDFDISSGEISDIYRCRWQIELFFKWIKQHLKVKHFYGYSAQAVENQLYIALITFCLLSLIKAENDYKGSLLELKRLLIACQHLSYQEFLKRLRRKPTRTSRGRVRPRHELIFKQTYHQVMAGDVDFLYDETYDPIIL